MSVSDPSHRDALLRMGAATAEAVAGILETFVPGQVERGDVTVYGDGDSPLNALMRGSVAASVSYVDGVTGANIFVLGPAGARVLAGAMGVSGADGEGVVEGGDVALTELEVSAISEAANQMMAAAAAAIGVVLGQEIEISVPDTRVIQDPKQAAEAFGAAPHATATTFMIAGESARLIQLVPSAFVVRMATALDEFGHDPAEGLGSHDGPTIGSSVALRDALGDIKLRVWAELGRTDLALGAALGLPLGAVVELDRPADAPVDLFVNGLRFASGHVIVTDDGEWAFAIDEVDSSATAAELAAGVIAGEVIDADDIIEVDHSDVADSAIEAGLTTDSTPRDPNTPTDTPTEGAGV
jgi:flagellar motor switch protein FliN/FliY